MHYNLNFLIASLVFLSLILYHFVNRRKLADPSSRIFQLFLVLGITDIAFDLGTTLLISAKKPELANITSLMLTFFYLMQALIPYALFLYSRSLYSSQAKQESVIPIIPSLPAFFMAVMILFNYWSGIFFFIDQYGNYIQGPFYLYMYYYAGFYVIIILISSLWNYRRLGSKKFSIICEFLLIMATCVTIQAIWHEILTTGLGLGLGIMVLYLTINNPSDYTDPLTEDYNIKGFLGYLQELYRQKTSFHIIALNIQNIKQINMLFGIHFGDAFLFEISKMLHEILNTPYVFRISSKRFVLLTYSFHEYERVRNEVQNLFHSSISLNGEQIQLSAIICGILNAEKSQNSDALLAYMDYLASLSPSSTETILIQNDEKTMKNFQYTKEIEHFLRTAIDENLFEVFYQPVFSLEQGDYVALEALSRLRHPTFGSVPPDVFISIAERSGQIAQIGMLQLRRICVFVKEHPELMSKIHHININLSPAELLRDGYSRQIIETIQEYALPFSFFQIEITETVATEYNDSLYQLTEDFKQYGIRLSLDDFGSGYANLNAVLRLPFSCIKLDRSLLNGILEDTNAKMFYKNIVTALKSMGYNVISEGVEHKKEVELLQTLGVDMIQGYYFSRPLPPDELLKLLGTNETQ